MTEQQRKLIIVERTKYVLAFWEDEFDKMLKAFPDIWTAGIKRGKQVVRLGKSMERVGKR